ncbi:hypothetical protein K8R04_04110 [Candidatus Uhrbacteria bacterium]|nr:hypothetical protein [Candidatus Uhrbacteria bacterium]
MNVSLRTFFRSALAILGGFVCVFVFQIQTSLAAPQINNQINYQARLMDASGFPVADGNYSIIFSLYDASTAGTRLWTASGTVGSPTALTVNVQNGLFTVLLGDTSVGGGSQNTLDTVNWNSDQLYLGVTINADSEMTPRKRFASAPQAFNARQLQGMYASSTASGGQTLFTVNQTEANSATGTRTALDVRSNGTSSANDFLIRGINDLGSTVFSVNRQGNATTSFLNASNIFASMVTSTNLQVNIASFATATIAGQGVCLSNGSFCSSTGGSSTDLNWTLNQAGDFVRNATATTDIAIGSSTLANAPFVFLNNTTTSRFLVGQNSSTGAGADLVIGATTSSNMHALFQLSGDDLFVAGNIGSASSVFTNGEFIAGNASTHYGDGYINKDNGILTVEASSHLVLTSTGGGKVFVSAPGSSVMLGAAGSNPGIIVFQDEIASDLHVNANNVYDLGSSVTSVRNIYASGTIRSVSGVYSSLFATNASATTFIATSGTVTTLNSNQANITNLTVFNDETITGTSTVNGNIFLGNSTNQDRVIFTSTIDSNLMPTTNDTYSLGQIGQAWRGFFSSVTTTNLTVNGQSVCLANGTNCTATSTDLNWTYNLAGDFVRNATGTTDIAIGSSTLANSPFVFLNNTTTSRFLIGRNSSTGAGADLVIGAATSSGMSPAFQLTGDDLFVAGNIGSASSIYTNGAFVAGTGTTFFSDGMISKTNGYLNVKSTSGTRVTNALEQFISSDISPTLLGSTGVIPKASRFVVVGSYAYVLSNSGPLYIVDISDPTHPTSTGFIDVPATPVSIAYVGGKIYVGTGTNDVYVYDVADKSAPALVDTLVGVGSFIQIDGNVLYTVTIASFNIYDLKGNLLSTFAIDSAKFTVQNGRAYILATTPDRLAVYDVVNPSNPVLLSTATPFTTTPTNIAVKDRYAYVTEESANAFWILDVSNGASVSVAASTTIPSVSMVSVSGRYAYVSSSTTDVVVLDVSSSTAPVQVLDFETSPGSVRQFSIFGRYGILSGGGTPDGYLQIYDMKGTELQSLTAHSLQAGSVRVGDLFTVEGQSILNGGLQVGLEGISSGGSIFVSATNTTSTYSGYVKAARVQATDVFEALGPMTLGDDSGDLISIGGSIASDIVPDSVGRTLGSSFLPWDGYFRSVTATSLITSGRGVTAEPPSGSLPDADIVSTSTLVGGNPIGIFASDRYLYYIGGNNGLEIIDITDPNFPFITASSTLDGFGTSKFVTNGSVIALGGQFNASQRGIRILDVSNFANVTSVGDLVLTNDSISGIDMSGNYVFAVASASSALYIVDISTPGSPTLVSSMINVLGSPTDVKVRDGFAYITEGTGNRLYIVDVRKPNQPIITGSVAVANAPQDVLQQGRYAYVSLSTTQFVTIDVSDPTAPYAIATSTCPSYDCTGGFIAGDYLIRRARDFFSPNNDYIHFWDISRATGPVTLSQLEMVEPTAPTEQMQKLTKYGSYVYTIHSDTFVGATTGVLSVVDVGGVKTDGIQAGTGEFGTLMVRNAAEMAKQLTVQGGLQVGTNGVLSRGPISSTATGTASSFAGMLNVQTSTSTSAVTIRNTLANTGGTAWGAYIDQLTVGSNASATGTANYSMVLTYASSATFGGLCIDDTSTGQTCPTNVGASIMADGAVISNAFDIAEMYSVTGTSEAGDVLVLDASSTATVMRSTGVAYDSKVIGIVSTDPGFVLGWSGGTKVALAGRVPTKVSMNNGSIAVGDALVSSDVPGYAMKATQPGMILGYALESASATGTAQVFVSVGFWAGLAFGPTGQIQVDDSGNVSIMNDLHVGGRLFPSLKGGGIQNDWYLFVNADDPTSTYISTNAAGFMSMDTYDFAERYYSPDELEPGDLVIVSDSGRTHVQRSMNTEQMLLGIVSTRPAFIAGRPATSTYPIALSGRVPTKVSNINGAIKAGDPLSPTSVPGVAAKAIHTGPIIGLALEDFESANIDKIEVFVNPGWWTNVAETNQQTVINQTVVSSPTGVMRRGVGMISAGSKRVHIAFDTIAAYPFVQVTPRGLIQGNWGTDGYSDTGFDIIMSQEQTFDTYFSWQVEPLQGSDRLNLSDGTTADMDPVTGLPFGFSTTTTTEPIVEEPVVASTEPVSPPTELIDTPAQSEVVPTEEAPVL